ncbi:MAG: carbamoyl-phosphate synthase large subunit [Deltaproteobacteria bacterium]|nr:carbamoyl-phosphate synthase large subunit [Deltaproteobacteria bacterium]
MPKRTDIKKIMLIGSGPIVIGQACEFDYSGTQACKALREEGYEVVLVNSNPATIMTDPEMAQRTYIEPITPEIIEQIIARERPDALLPTVGGQTALNAAVAVAKRGVLEKYKCELIGANLKAIETAEDRQLFKDAMIRIGLDLPRSHVVRTVEEGMKAAAELGFPLILRPAFTMGGSGGGIVYSAQEYQEKLETALRMSPVSETLVEESVLGWKEYELEVMRDTKDNVVIICSIENLDPMGVHTGDSITIAPAQTLTDKEYQIMRDAALAIIREVGVDTGGSNVQFAVDPRTGRLVVVEMNPRVSRSSALASKATGFPIAKIAAKLAVGYSLDEIPNDITKVTPASFEPTIDYVVTKVPRFTFEKFPAADATLTTQMKSVGEVMAIGRTFKESLQKALRSLEIDRYGFEVPSGALNRALLEEKLRIPGADRLWYLAEAIRQGLSDDQLYQLTRIDPWFLRNIREIVETEKQLMSGSLPRGRDLRRLKQMGFSDRRLGKLTGYTEAEIREARHADGIRPVYKRVDTCAAEFEAKTPYLYSTYEQECESQPTGKKKVMILGGGPNRIGQGIEFDYCCVHAAMALREDGFETIMINCNPETVSTDYDTSDRLYFEPLTLEDVLEIVNVERPWGVIVQFGGQTPLKLSVALGNAGVPIIGTPPDVIDMAEDRERFAKLVDKLKIRQPPNGIARSAEEALQAARRIGYPVVVRPSYVLGGRAMEICHDQAALLSYMERAVIASPDHPVLIDRFLNDATEVDVDCLADRTEAVICGVMEHIEEAGVHSGDSACSIPPMRLNPKIVEEIQRLTRILALELGVVGLMNVQWAVQGEDIYILEVNPRASRTVPFVAKATGVPWAKMGARVMAGRTIRDLGVKEITEFGHVAVKESVFPFIKFPGVDTMLGPEMKSTGEVMGIDRDFGRAFWKGEAAAGTHIPSSGLAFISVRDEDKAEALDVAKGLVENGFSIIATHGTAEYLKGNGVSCETVSKVAQGSPHIVDWLEKGRVALVINTSSGTQSIADSYSIRRTALVYNVPYATTMAAASAMVTAIRALKCEPVSVMSLQEYHPHVRD